MPVLEAIRFRAGVNMPLVSPTVSVEEAYAQAERFAPGGRRAGALLIVDDSGALAGIFTDGDLRRLFLKHGSAAWRDPIGKHMTRNPRRLTDAARVRDAVQMVREFRIDEVPIVDAGGRPLGLIDVQDLVALKVIEG
jgi:arabinose-5-phosphate isomerase